MITVMEKQMLIRKNKELEKIQCNSEAKMKTDISFCSK